MSAAVAARPPHPDRNVPDEGWEVLPDPGWTTDLIHFHRQGCRFGASGVSKACGNEPVAALRRGKVWYAYCEDHLYGRWIENDTVVNWYVKGDWR